jgi:hypothetical protein
MTYCGWICSGESKEADKLRRERYARLTQPYLVASRCDTINFMKKITMKTQDLKEKK